MTGISGTNFDAGFPGWQEYQQAPWGRLRYRVAGANLARHLPAPPARLLDLGGGNGLDSLPLVEAGYTAVVVDFSEEMLAQGRKSAAAAGVADRIRFHLADATQFQAEASSFDIILCHNLLQYVPKPTAVLQAIETALRPEGVFSLMITNPYAETMAYALRDYDLSMALETLQKKTRYVELFQTAINRYDEKELREMLAGAGFTELNMYGVRCMIDFMADDERKYDPGFYAQLEELEMVLSDREPYRQLARFYQIICRRQASRERR